MKKLLLALALCLLPTLASAQCNGVFNPNTLCGNNSGSPGIPGQFPVSALTGLIGGTNGQIQYNNSGVFGGFTASGDATINTTTGVVTNSKFNNGTTFGSAAGASTGTSGHTVPFLDGANVWSGSNIFPINVQTIDYAIATTDCGGTVQVGTGTTGLKTITLPAASGFTARCIVKICNGDTGRGKKTSGFPSDIHAILWPLQCTIQAVVNSAWKTVSNPGRWILPTSEELCVRQDGSATSDGLGNGTVAADCMNLAQTAVTTIGQQWDGTGYYACSIGYYTGGTSTFAEQVSMTGQSVGCYLTFNWHGATTHTSTANCFTGGDNGIGVFNMNLGFVPTFKCNSGNNATNAVWYCHQTCIYDVTGQWQWVPGGTNDSMIFLDGQGRVTVNATGNIVIGDGSAETFGNMFQCDQHCAQFQISGPIAFSANVSCTRIFAAYEGSAINTTASFTGSCTGITTSISSGLSVINTNGSTILGGTTTAGTGGAGQVCTTKC